MHPYMLYLVEELLKQTSEQKVIITHTHFRLVVNLSPLEKEILAKKCIEWSWNVGSANLLQFLQKVNVLTMSEYMLFANNQSVENAQLIFNDLLETEFVLLADLLKHINITSPDSLVINDILLEGFNQLCRDLIENPSVLIKNYLLEVKPFALDDCLDQVRVIHLNIFLQKSQKNTTEEAINCQQVWNSELSDDQKVFNSFLASIVGEHRSRCKTFASLLEKCENSDFQCWKYLLHFLRITIEGRYWAKLDDEFIEINELKTIAKQFMKSVFRKFLAKRSERIFHTMFLIARQISYYNESLIGSYAIWYKEKIGELKYIVKNDEFIFVMELLIKMIKMETDIDNLHVHINTYIPAPLHCNEIVLNYKQLCRSKLLHLQRKNKSNRSSNASTSAITDDRAMDVDVVDDD